MRYAVVADIHGNLEALQAVLDDVLRAGGCDGVLCLGDVVGYGPDPHECVNLLRKENHFCVAGNHDHAAIGLLGQEEFNPDAAVASRWTEEHLTAEDVDFLRVLPVIRVIDRFTLVHGSPREPVWEYITNTDAASGSLSFFKTPHCLVGHTHVPTVFRCEVGRPRCIAGRLGEGERLNLSGGRMIMNPGGVGQPRDGDPRAAYALLDLEEQSIRGHRVVYDVARTQEKMLRAGLPESLARRLSFGT